MHLELILVVTITAVALFNLGVCVVTRSWGLLIFASLMYGAMAALMIYGAGHTPGA